MLLNTGFSPPLWQPDNPILATQINHNERVYGGFYFSDSIVASATTTPVLSVGTFAGEYGNPIMVYGFCMYSGQLNSTLFVDSLAAATNTPTFTDGTPVTEYGSGVKYGFAAYGT